MMDIRPQFLLLDTNVWLDFFDGNSSRSHDASRLLERCIELDITLLFAVESVKDVYYLLRQSLKRRARDAHGTLSDTDVRAASRYAVACVDTLAEVGCAVGTGASDAWLARRYLQLHDDLEDTLMIAAAQRAQADCLITSNDKLLRHAPVATLSVSDMLQLLGKCGANPAARRVRATPT